MRLRASSACLTSLVLIIACADPDPIYPTIPDYLLGRGGTGSLGTGAGSTGATTGEGATGATGATGASSNGAAGKSSNNTGGKSGGGNSKGGSGNMPSGDPCSQPWSGEELPPASPACDLDNLEDGGSLTGDITADRTLQRNHFYNLDGEVRVMAGKTLTIEPCVKILGSEASDVLVVMSADNLGDQACTFSSGKPVQAGKLVAAGEPMAPIIFTSSRPKGQRTPGDWGGVMILGNAQHNDCAADRRAVTEGLEQTECYGWYTNEFNGESSGKLEYVRIEYASKQVDMGAETNGLTLAGVGSGTSIHHVMVSNSNDDCFEWFGGTVNAHHLIALNCEDDMFDSDKGFSGHLQFLFGRQFQSSGEGDSRGFEVDSGPGIDNPEHLYTRARFSNVTICGGGPTDQNTSRNGLAFRANAEPALMNALVTGFAGGGILVQGSAAPTVTYTTVFDNTNGVQSLSPKSDVSAEWFTGQVGNSVDNPGFCDCWQPKPVAVAVDRIPGVKPEGFDDPDADYQGAFEDASSESNWMQGLWVDWSDN